MLVACAAVGLSTSLPNSAVRQAVWIVFVGPFVGTLSEVSHGPAGVVSVARSGADTVSLCAQLEQSRWEIPPGLAVSRDRWCCFLLIDPEGATVECVCKDRRPWVEPT